MTPAQRCLYYLCSKSIDVTRAGCMTLIKLYGWLSFTREKLLSRMSDKE